MKCKNCNHKITFYEGKWEHWNGFIHANIVNGIIVEKGKCSCINPEPKEKTLGDFNNEKKI